MSVLRQTIAVARLTLMALAGRPGSALVVILGMACVVGVMQGVLAVTAGLSQASTNGTDPRNVIVHASDASEDNGSLTRDTCSALVQAPGVAHGPDGRVLVDCELLQPLPLNGFAFGMLFVRGVGERVGALNPHLRIVAGRAFRPGFHEMIVGVGASSIFHLQVGDSVIMPDGSWPIVGAFVSGGGVFESQLLTDTETLASTVKMNGFNSVLMQLNTADGFPAFARWINESPALAAGADRQADYYLQTVGPFLEFFTSLAYFIASVLAVGALFGSLNVMYGRVRARTREIITLRIFGFGALPIALSVVLAALLLCVVGALVGASIAWLLLNGHHSIVVHTTYQLSVSWHYVLIGLLWAITIGLVGSLLPGLRAVRLPVTAGLRESVMQ